MKLRVRTIDGYCDPKPPAHAHRHNQLKGSIAMTTTPQPRPAEAPSVQLRNNYPCQDTDCITLRVVDGHYAWSGAAELIDGFASRYTKPRWDT